MTFQHKVPGIKDIYEEYKNGGVRNILVQVWRYILLYSFLSPQLRGILGDILHEKLVRSVTIGYWPKIKNPRSLNEKTMHRKIYTENDIFSIIEDKVRVRNYVQKKVGSSYLNETYFITEDPGEIPFKNLPDEFVVKANHGSSWNILVENKDEADYDKIRETCQTWLSQTYAPSAKEYWYQDIPPKIIVEEYLEGINQEIPRDYKFFVYDGTVEYVLVDIDRMGDHRRAVFDRDWNWVPVSVKFPRCEDVDKPETFEEMLRVAEELGKEFDFLRVDLYNTAEHGVVFGELTVAHGSGGSRIRPIDYDFEFGTHWDVQ
ncbi:TupA-like ATPgrasp domain [Halalkaliarchaeum sp. AArc-CO]|uniref:ATP-grasp fold amidoligase family protein n=1 Tax=Halalkaliarchaeum sp. AArc-CO TaxID=2866381 RepID=UPI00217D1064|nr:ATP-grasp fold amidoligase family protein [Halalkaliarchaeum sp. AArc-CO]UWG52012.1 TupA-like ATPgrasp domain [Halalkaliarchaeum sp. AArc-CO]